MTAKLTELIELKKKKDKMMESLKQANYMGFYDEMIPEQHETKRMIDNIRAGEKTLDMGEQFFLFFS